MPVLADDAGGSVHSPACIERYVADRCELAIRNDLLEGEEEKNGEQQGQNGDTQ